MHAKFLTLPMLGVIFGLSACASDPAKELAKATTLNVIELSKQIEDYKRSQDALTEERLNNQADLDIRLTELQSRLDREIRVARAVDGKSNRIKLFDELKKISDASIADYELLRDNEEAREKELKLSLTPLETQKKELASVSKQLAALAEEGSRRTRLAETLDLVSQIRSEIEQARKLADERAIASESDENSSGLVGELYLARP